jgi:hypothetical protein
MLLFIPLSFLSVCFGIGVFLLFALFGKDAIGEEVCV